LYNGLIQGLQRHVEVDEPEEDGFDAMAANPEFAQIAGQASEQAAAEAGLQVDEDDDEGTGGQVGAHPAVSYEDVDEDKDRG
jgi:DNA-directed RNA polymerase subunit omega